MPNPLEQTDQSLAEMLASMQSAVEAGLAATSPKTPAATILGVNLVSLVKLAPLNPVVRTQVQAIMRKPVPDELKDPDKIFEWVENNWDRKRPANNPTKPGTAYLGILVTASEVEFGHCNYKTYRSGREEYQISDEDVIDAVNAAIDDEEGLSGAVDNIMGTLAESVSDSPPEMTDDEVNHYDEESDERQDFEWQVRGGNTSVRTALVAYLRACHPELERSLNDQDVAF